MCLHTARRALQQITHFIEQCHLRGAELEFVYQAIKRLGMVPCLRSRFHLFRNVFVNRVRTFHLAIQSNGNSVHFQIQRLSVFAFFAYGLMHRLPRSGVF